MGRYCVLLTTILLVSCAALVVSQSSNQARCFQFTWLGPRWTNESTFMNATCSDATRMASGIPCQQPLVVSYDGTWPDVDYIWNNYQLQASCVLAANDVCAQYSYFFNGEVENSTYMCTRALDNNDAAVTSGCFQQTNGSFSTRVCFCRSVAGGRPCNSGIQTALISIPMILTALTLIVRKNLL